MKMDEPYKTISTFPQGLISEIKETLSEADWYDNDPRRVLPNLGDCNSIMLRWLDSSSYDGAGGLVSGGAVVHYRLYKKYKTIIDQTLILLRQNYKFAEYIALFARLEPRGIIGEHRDVGAFLENCHRVHIPIATNPDVKYVIDGIENYWPAGHVYEFDNTRPHSVINRSDEYRTHLLINLYPTANVHEGT